MKYIYLLFLAVWSYTGLAVTPDINTANEELSQYRKLENSLEAYLTIKNIHLTNRDKHSTIQTLYAITLLTEILSPLTVEERHDTVRRLRIFSKLQNENPHPLLNLPFGQLNNLIELMNRFQGNTNRDQNPDISKEEILQQAIHLSWYHGGGGGALHITPQNKLSVPHLSWYHGGGGGAHHITPQKDAGSVH